MKDQDPISTHGSCPDCGANGCLSTWADGNTFCHSCGESTAGKKVAPKVVDEAGTRHSELDKYSRKRLPYRNLTQKAVDKYRVDTLVDSEGKEIAREYHYPHRNKYRVLPKDFSPNKGFSNDHLYGMDLFNSGSTKYVTVVEGEDDAPAAWQMLGGREPVVAIPGASISKELLKKCHDWLNGFDGIIVATDGDSAGDKAADKLASVFPNKVYRVSLTKHKDPQDYLHAGDQAEFKMAWVNRKKYVPQFDISTPDQFLKLIRDEEDDSYISSGIDAYDEEHMGLFQGHLTLFQAPEGTGKTELFHFFEYHLLKNHPDIPFASCHLEESEKRTTLAWASYELDKNVTRTDLIDDQEEVERAVIDLTKNETAHLFSIGTDEDPMVLLDRIKYYVEVCGCKYIFIEPIQDLAQQYYGPESTERFLSKIAVNLSRIAKEKKVGILLIGHENDDGLISDCRKLSKQASVVVRLERDIENTDPDIRNTTTLKSKKNRPASFVGYGGQLKFDPSTFKLVEQNL